MNNLTMDKRKIMQFSLSPESQEILHYFNKKYGTNKSLIIDRALKMLAGKFHTTISIHYEMVEGKLATNLTKEEIEQFEKLQKIARENIWE